MSYGMLDRSHGRWQRESVVEATQPLDSEIRLGVWRFGLATTLAFSALYLACALAVALFPQGTLDFFNAWFHGLDLSLLRPAGGRSLTVQQFVVGWLGVIVVAFPAGSLLAWTYNAMGSGAAQSR